MNGHIQARVKNFVVPGFKGNEHQRDAFRGDVGNGQDLKRFGYGADQGGHGDPDGLDSFSGRQVHRQMDVAGNGCDKIRFRLNNGHLGEQAQKEFGLDFKGR